MRIQLLLILILWTFCFLCAWQLTNTAIYPNFLRWLCFYIHTTVLSLQFGCDILWPGCHGDVWPPWPVMCCGKSPWGKLWICLQHTVQRETFKGENFCEFWDLVAICVSFLRKIWGAWHLLVDKQANCESFLCKKKHFPPICESFLPWKISTVWYSVRKTA